MRTRALISFAVLSNLVAFMSPSPGKCVFCGGGPLTKGHIWPEWMQQILPPKKHHLQFTGQIASIAPGAPVKQRLRQGHAGQRKPRNTCSACNTGWMSNIERDAIPYASPLILGQPVSLDLEAQKHVARLVCLMAMRAEFLDLKTLATTSQEREFLKNNLEPPPNWKIWIARYFGKNEQHWVYHHGLAASSPDQEIRPCDTQTTTMVLGQLCTHAFSSRSLPDFQGYEGVHLFRIWPPNTPIIDWWATLGISDAAIISLSEAFVRDFVTD